MLTLRHSLQASRWLLVGLLTCCATEVEPRVVEGIHTCPPCPEGSYCGTNVMVKDRDTGEIVCHPSYCVVGTNPLCEMDPEACAE